ncbi:MAG: SDR family oxidoreductase [Nitrospinaceae bacterium]|nr:SDR family oxidoreductase [Nitrospinaceae bacterium]MBT3435119.1 SDR family oxidoreductase [Nitrospinaceae bacterium]MBT3822926.1 SDR family oxidoreductase [Nitrospinaceae bacterium]MBT4095205.1 SDR family oxidoreductase [Nitrospinaceae bacterium]MBT4430230.1 SDR family oxidoreductase [Nitrospinaceae bacterium]
MRLKDKVAIVTGGSLGIGKAISLAYGREGAKVAVVNRTKESGAAVVKEIEGAGGVAQAFPCDVSKKAEVDAMVSGVAQAFGTVDILMGNAGVMINKPAEEYTEDEWDTVIDINLKGNFLLSQAVIPIMKKKKYGKIVFTASIAGTHAFPNALPYCASKGGVVMITKALAAEIAKEGINVNCISPGNTATPLNQHLQDDPEFVKLMASFTPTGRAYITVEEMAGAAVFLASDEASAVHGLDMIVDDGWCVM